MEHSLHLLGELLRVLADGVGQLGYGVQQQVVQDHLKQSQLHNQNQNHPLPVCSSR